MTREELFEIFGGIDDEYIASAEMPERAKPWTKWGAIAACLCLLAAGAFRIAIAFIPNQATDIFREGVQYEIESVYDLPAEYDGKILVQNLELSDAAAVEFYYKEGGAATDTADWYSLIVADYQSDRQLLMHCMFGDTTVDDWKVSMVFTKEATQTITINGVDVQLARHELSLDYEYWHYAIFEYDGVVYDVRLKSDDEQLIYELLERLIAGTAKNPIDSDAFADILGFEGCSISVEETAYRFYTWHFYAEIDGEKQCIAEMSGRFDDKMPDAYSVDLDGDGIDELICNCVYGDGVKAVEVYRNNNGVIEKGYISGLFDELGAIRAGLMTWNEWYDPDEGFTVMYCIEVPDSDEPEINTYTFNNGLEDFDFSPFVPTDSQD